MERTLPKHRVQEPEFADPNFTLPKIPKKDQIIKPQIVQVEEQASSYNKEETPIESSANETVIEFKYDNIKLGIIEFAKTISISLAALIKVLTFDFEGFTINIRATQQQIDAIGDNKIDWQRFMRQYFKNNQIIINLVLDDEVVLEKKAYTQSEQLEEMLQENDNLKYLVNKLKLKISY